MGNSLSQRYDTASRARPGHNISVHLNDLPGIKPGGQLLPPRDQSIDARLRHLSSESEKLRQQIADKQKVKRAGLREWSKLEQDSASAAIKADLSEETMRMVNGEDVSSTAF
jgi:N-acetylmuramoyl-L-alanine amidase